MVHRAVGATKLDNTGDFKAKRLNIFTQRSGVYEIVRGEGNTFYVLSAVVILVHVSIG